MNVQTWEKLAEDRAARRPSVTLSTKHENAIISDLKARARKEKKLQPRLVAYV